MTGVLVYLGITAVVFGSIAVVVAAHAARARARAARR